LTTPSAFLRLPRRIHANLADSRQRRSRARHLRRERSHLPLPAADILSEFKRRYPLASHQHLSQFQPQILQRLKKVSLDIGIVTLPLKSPNLKMHVLNRDRLRFMVSSKNPLRNAATSRFEEIRVCSLDFSENGYTRQVLDKLSARIVPVQVAMNFPSIGMIKTFVAADVGIFHHQRKFRPRSGEDREVKLLNVEGVEPVARTRSGLTVATAACRAPSAPHQHDSRKPQACEAHD